MTSIDAINEENSDLLDAQIQSLLDEDSENLGGLEDSLMKLAEFNESAIDDGDDEEEDPNKSTAADTTTTTATNSTTKTTTITTAVTITTIIMSLIVLSKELNMMHLMMKLKTLMQVCHY